MSDSKTQYLHKGARVAMAAASDFAPTKFALLREYYTPVAVAEAVADLPCAALQADRDSAVQPSAGIGRLVRALGGRSS
jgi:hypothetical protein